MTKTGQIISSGDWAQELDDPDDDTVGLEIRELSVLSGQHGERIDKILVAGSSEFSRSYLQQLVLGHAVEVNGQVVAKASARLRAGDLVRVALRPTPQSRAFKPQPIPLDVVFRDAHLMIVHKPAGMVVHPAPGNWSGTLLNALLALDPLFADLPRAGIVHRLDKDTSGLMLVACNRQSMDRLVQMIAERVVQRQYLALAHKTWVGPGTREIEAPIGRDPRNRLRMAVLDAARGGSKGARTTVELLANHALGCLVKCTLHTGRTHQIRVHLASVGHPLIGDRTYGGVAALGMTRQALHAYHLALPHPANARKLEFYAALPEDMARALDQWGLGYNRP